MQNTTLIIGLGNPGRKYKKTRHNIGFRVLDKFKEENNFPKFKMDKKLQSEITEKIADNKKTILVKPQTFMNSSGVAVKAIMNFYGLAPTSLIIVHDELDLPLGEVKLSQDKGSAGHNGIKSIIQHIGTQDFIRIRIGIKPSVEIKNAANFVLKKFSKDEEQTLEQAIKKACQTFLSGT